MSAHSLSSTRVMLSGMWNTFRTENWNGANLEKYYLELNAFKAFRGARKLFCLGRALGSA